MRQQPPRRASRPAPRRAAQLFIQDYNTATLPHRKYYDLQAHHLRVAAKEAAAGGPPKAAEVDFSKMEDERKRELAGDRARKAEDDKKHLIQHMMLTGKLAGLRRARAAPACAPALPAACG